MAMKTIEQIDNEHTTNVQNIRSSHLERHEISHEEYHIQLNAENERYETEFAANFPSVLPRDLLAEVTALKTEQDELKARLDKITKVNGVA